MQCISFSLGGKLALKICTWQGQVIMIQIKLTENRLFCLNRVFQACFSRITIQKHEANEGNSAIFNII
jgi:hypothetical protein